MLGDVELNTALKNPESEATTLHIACQHNNLDFAELLLKHGAQVNAPI